MITRRRLRRVAGVVALLYAAYALLVLYVLPPVARHQAQTRLSALLQRPVTVSGIYLNPFTFRLRIRGVEVREPDGETLFAGVDRVAVNLDPVRCALQRGLVVREVTVDGPHAIVIRRPDASFNVSDLLKPKAGTEPAKPAAPASGPPRFSVSNIQIREGWFLFRDQVTDAQQRLTGVQLSVPAVSSLPNYVEVFVQPAFRAHLNGRELVLDSQAKPFAESQEGDATLRLHDLDLTAFAHYLPEPRNVDLSSGRLDVDLRVRGLRGLQKEPSLSVTGDVGLRDLCLRGRDGRPLAAVGALRVSLLPAELMQRQVHLGNITCTAPFLRLTRDAKGALVLPRIGAAPGATPAPVPAPAPTPASTSPAVTADVDEVLVRDGRVEFADASVKTAFQTQVGLQLEVKGLTTRPDRPIQVHITTTTESQETVEGTYTVTLFPQLAVSGTTAVKGVRLPKYMPYLEEALASAITRGTLDVKVDHAITLPTGAPPSVQVTDLDLAVRDFCLTAEADAAPVLSVQELTLTDATADLGTREVVVGAFATRGGEVRVQRLKDGSLNLQKLVRARPAPAPAVAPPAAPTAPSPATPWVVTVRDAAIAGWAVAFDDEQPGTAVHLAVRDIAVAVKGLTTRADPKSTVNLSLRLNDKASLAITGGFSAKPLTTDLTVRLKDLEMKDFQPYVADRLNLLISDGALETDLNVAVGQVDGGAFTGTVGGMVALRRFVSVDPVNAEDFVKCQELALRGIAVDLKPLAVRVNEVALNGLGTSIAVKPDGTLNLLSVVKKAPAAGAATTAPAAPPPATPAASGGDPFPLEIGAVRLDGCAITFTDQQTTPHYRVSLDELAGTITAFSLGRPTPAQVSLAARLDGHAPFTLQATLADLGPQMTLSAATALKDFDLSPVTPYSGRYVGYAVRRGKLNVDLKYDLKQRQLAAEHRVLVDQFAFGQKVESPEATDLPVRLAVALLKDRKGQINIDVPVRGSLDDPEFSVLRVVLKVLRDLVAKAATAPFAMLGALVGGGEELSYVDFAPGSADLDDTGIKKLELLAKALLDRPELQVEAGGTVDRTTDREALAAQAVLRQLKARKLAAMVKAGTPAGSLDEVALAAAERDAMLRAIYRETVAAATPPGTTPPTPEPTPAEIEQQLAARVTVTEEEVRQLGGRRAARVREFLTTAGQVQPERVFVVDAVPPPAGAAEAPARQARLSLR